MLAWNWRTIPIQKSTADAVAKAAHGALESGEAINPIGSTNTAAAIQDTDAAYSGQPSGPRRASMSRLIDENIEVLR
jgi:hypothetical protein